MVDLGELVNRLGSMVQRANRRGTDLTDGLDASTVQPLIESWNLRMTATDERVALQGICVCERQISEEEVSDFCSVLSLADRVFVAGSADATTEAAMLRLILDEFGFAAHVLDTATVCHAEPTHTVVAISGPQADAGLMDVLRPVCDTEAVLLAVATDHTLALLRRADAAITVPSTACEKSIGRGPA